jgi:hypothetical protein
MVSKYLEKAAHTLQSPVMSQDKAPVMAWSARMYIPKAQTPLLAAMV